jgi:hypothetical protein
MTAEDLLHESYFNIVLDIRETYLTDSDITSAMKEYARLKCEELLKIVAENAQIKVEKKSQYGKSRKWQKVKENEEFGLFDYEMRTSVDKSSILNAVDLNEFIK